MRLVLHVRELEFAVECGKAQQDFKWLGKVAALRYSEEHENSADPNQYIPINVVDAKKHVYFPREKISTRCANEDHLYVELLGPKVGAPDEGIEREISLWERYAFTAPEEWVSVIISYDATGVSLSEPPKVFGNFNGWGEAIPMAQIPGTETYQLERLVPVGSEIVFKFVVDKKEICSDRYARIRDEDSVEHNYFQVVPRLRSYSELQDPVAPQDYSFQAPVFNGRQVSSRIVGAFEGVKEITDQMRKEMFEIDWEAMQFADIVREKVRRLNIRGILWEKYDPLRVIFQFFSSHGGGDITFMSVLEFLHFCHICKIPDSRVTVNKIDRIFRRVNIEEVFDEEVIENNPNEYRNAMRIVPDPFNPNNQFIRGEFLEALVRLAKIKYPHLEVEPAFQKLLEDNVLPYATKESEDDLRQRLLDPSVQQVYRKYAKKLYRLFCQTAKLDSSDNDDTTISLKEFEMLLQRKNLVDKELSRRAAFSAFAMSQDATLNNDENYEMVYGEFLEVLGRLAKIKYATENMPLAQQLEALLHVLFTK